MVYLINLIVVVLYYVILGILCKDAVKRRKMFATMVCIHAVLFRALANPFNYVDTTGYADAFANIGDMTFRDAVLRVNYYTSWGQGYVLLNWLVSKVSSDFQVFYMVSAALGIIPVIWFYYKTAPRLLFPLLIYLSHPMMYYMGFGVLRQHLSVAFILLAIYHIHSLKKSIPLAFIACMLHTSGIVLIPFYFWNRIKVNQRFTFKFVMILTIGFIVFQGGMRLILSFLPRYLDVVKADEVGNRLPMIWFACITIASLYTKTFQKVQSKVELMLLKFLYYGLLLSVYCVGLAGMGRFTLCFVYIAPIVSMIVVKYSKDQMVNTLVILSNIIVVLVFYFVQEHYDLAYSFYWEPKVTHVE